MTSEPIYTQDWFKLAIPTLDIVLKDIAGKDNLTFMEIGSFEGRSTIWFLENILTGKNSKMICIDTFTGSPEHKTEGVDITNLRERFNHNLKPYKGRYQAIEGMSRDVLRTKHWDNSLDLVYIDGSHTAADVMTDAVLTFPMVKSGGLIIFDDYMWHYNRLPANRRPKLAIDAFMEAFVGKVQAVSLVWKTMVLRKL